MSLIQVIGGRELSVVSSFWNTKGWEVGGLTVLVFQPHRWGWILSFFFTCWYSNNRYKWLVFSQMPYLFSVIIIVIIIIILSGVSQWEVIGCHSWVWAVSSWHLVAEARTPVNIPQCAGHSHYRYTGLQTWLVPGGGGTGGMNTKKNPCLSLLWEPELCMLGGHIWKPILLRRCRKQTGSEDFEVHLDFPLELLIVIHMFVNLHLKQQFRLLGFLYGVCRI